MSGAVPGMAVVPVTAYELIGSLVGAFTLIGIVGGAAWRLGRSGRGEPAAVIYEQMNSALKLQVEQLKEQNSDQQQQIEKLKTDVAHLNEQVLQRAKVEELSAMVKESFTQMSDEHSSILGRIESLRGQR